MIGLIPKYAPHHYYHYYYISVLIFISSELLPIVECNWAVKVYKKGLNGSTVGFIVGTISLAVIIGWCLKSKIIQRNIKTLAR